MNKKFILFLILVSALVFSACTTKKSVTVGNSVSDTSIAGVIVKQKGNCQPVEVRLYKLRCTPNTKNIAAIG